MDDKIKIAGFKGGVRYTGTRQQLIDAGLLMPSAIPSNTKQDGAADADPRWDVWYYFDRPGTGGNE